MMVNRSPYKSEQVMQIFTVMFEQILSITRAHMTAILMPILRGNIFLDFYQFTGVCKIVYSLKQKYSPTVKDVFGKI